MANRLGTLKKDPNATLDYQVDWSSWMASGDTISASVWIVDSGISQVTTTYTDMTTTIWLSGGTAGSSYNITNRITTSDGRIDDATFTIDVEQR